MRLSLMSVLLLAFAGTARAQAPADPPPDAAAAPDAAESREAAPAEAQPQAQHQAASTSADRPARIRVRADAVMRWAPRWVLDVRETEVGAIQRFWHRVDELPLTLRVSFDAERLMQGRVGVHLATWGALDLTVDTEGGLVAGDVAVGYADVRLGPAIVWLGRRFIPWGPPGGLHLDGAGARVEIPHGLWAEAFAGRPVVSRVVTSTGASGNLSATTGAYGARLGWRAPGVAAADLAFVQRWAKGLEVDRLLDANFSASPHRRLDVRAGGTMDVRASRPSQAFAEVDLAASRRLRVNAGYAFVDPRALLPDWSVLKAFSSMLYGEASVGATLRVLDALDLRVEGAYRRSWLPDVQGFAALDGYRVDVYARVVPREHGVGFRVLVSRRDDGVSAYNLLQTGVAFDPLRDLRLALDLSAAFDDDLAREAYVARLSGEYRVADAWSLGASVDAARTPTADAEVRGLLRAVYRREVMP